MVRLYIDLGFIWAGNRELFIYHNVKMRALLEKVPEVGQVLYSPDFSRGKDEEGLCVPIGTR